MQLRRHRETRRAARKAAPCGLLALAACTPLYVVPEASVAARSHVVHFAETLPSRVDVQLHRGHVSVGHGAALECEIRIRVRAEDDATARSLSDAVAVLDELEAGVRRIRVSHPSGAALDAVDVHYHLLVPPEVGVSIRSHAAGVSLRGFNGRAEVRTMVGEILARPAGGSFHLESRSGPIELAGVYDEAEVVTRTGGVEVALPRGRSGTVLTVASWSGPVVVDMADDSDMLLRYATQEGRLRTDFPVRWETNGEAQEDGGRLYVGRLGGLAAVEADAAVRASVTCRSASFAVRRLADGSRSRDDPARQ